MESLLEGVQSVVPEIEERVLTTIGRRLLQSYRGQDPLKAMEEELSRILMEVALDEAQKADNTWIQRIQRRANT